MSKIIAYCQRCDGEDLKMDKEQKYLTCNNCGKRVYIRDYEVGLFEIKGDN